MTKPELVAAIMEHTISYKKTHLMDKHKAELEAIYAEIVDKPAALPVGEPETVSPIANRCTGDARGRGEHIGRHPGKTHQNQR